MTAATVMREEKMLVMKNCLILLCLVLGRFAGQMYIAILL